MHVRTVNKEMIVDLPGEEIMTTHSGRWQYVSVWRTWWDRNHRYYHLDCDALVDDQGICPMCCAPSPGTITH